MIRIYSEVFHPNTGATSAFISDIAFHIAKFDSVNVTTINTDKATESECVDGVNVKRLARIRFDNKGIASRILRAIDSSVKLLWDAILTIKSGDIVFAVTNPPILPNFLAVVCKLKGARLIIRVDDVYPEAMVAAGVLSNTRIKICFLRFLFRGFFFCADRIVVLGRDMKAIIRANSNLSAKQIPVIPNWAESDVLLPSCKSSNALLEKLELSEKFCVLVAGTIGYVQDVDTVLRAAKYLVEHDIHFIFVGDGSLRAESERYAKSNNLKHVHFVGSLPKSDQMTFLNACDFALVSLKKGMYGLGVPSRFYNYIVVGKPVIGTIDKGSEIDLLINEYGLGFSVAAGKPRVLADEILRAYRMETASYMNMAKICRNIAVTKFNKYDILKDYENLFNELSALKD